MEDFLADRYISPSSSFWKPDILLQIRRCHSHSPDVVAPELAAPAGAQAQGVISLTASRANVTQHSADLVQTIDIAHHDSSRKAIRTRG